MDFEKVTAQDCIDLFEKKNKTVVLNDGKLIGFQTEDQDRKEGND